MCMYIFVCGGDKLYMIQVGFKTFSFFHTFWLGNYQQEANDLIKESQLQMIAVDDFDTAARKVS